MFNILKVIEEDESEDEGQVSEKADCVDDEPSGMEH